MSVSHKRRADSVYATLAFLVATLHLIGMVWLLAAGNPGGHRNYLWFALAWLMSFYFLVMSVVRPAAKVYLTSCISINLVGILCVWTIVVLFPAWLFGEYLMAYGAHGGFAIIVSFLNSLPVMLCAWRRSSLFSQELV